MPNERDVGKSEPATERIEEAGKGDLDDEVLPDRGEPVEQERTGGETEDTAGRHGDMAPETAAGLERASGEGKEGQE